MGALMLLVAALSSALPRTEMIHLSLIACVNWIPVWGEDFAKDRRLGQAWSPRVSWKADGLTIESKIDWEARKVYHFFCLPFWPWIDYIDETKKKKDFSGPSHESQNMRKTPPSQPNYQLFGLGLQSLEPSSFCQSSSGTDWLNSGFLSR